MHVAARARRFLAQRPWVYWLVVALIATTITLVVRAQLGAVDDARGSWGRTRRVLVADVTLEPGGTVQVTGVELPEAMIPDGALTEWPAGATLRQRVAAGEVLVDIDIGALPGPAALAEPGTAVVALSDPLSRGLTIGLAVQIAADGLVIAEDGVIVGVVDEVVFVAVPHRDAATVAAAAQSGLASLVYLP